jgi:hypothetical protein
MRSWGGVLFVHVCAFCAAGIGVVSALTPQAGERAAPVREITWGDIAPPIQDLLSRRGITGDSFSARISDLRLRNRARMREGDLDHVVYYVLQSSAFTRLPAIEPAESAAQFVAAHAIPAPARSRIRAFAAALKHPRSNARLSYFRDILSAERVDAASTDTFLCGEYERAMRFLYEKEFAGKDRTPLVKSALYESRGLSTDTSVDAGFVVFLGLGALRQLEP